MKKDNLEISGEEARVALKEYYGEAIANLVCRNFALEKEYARLKQENEQLEFQLSQAKLDILAAQGKSVIDDR